MAYKSRVTNKYMGSSFAGQVASSRTSSTSDLINTLQKDVNPALAKIADQYVETKKDTAKEQINQLLLTKDSKTVQQEILSGKHPELSGQYVQKTVDFNVGRVAAVEAQAEIQANKSSYDYTKTNLPAFYKQYLPEFADKSGSYALGFAAVFEKFKSSDAIADAKIRSDAKTDKTITDISKLLSTATESSEAHGIVDSFTQTKLPNGMLATNEQGIQGYLRHANNVYSSATSPEEIDKVLSLFLSDRGKGIDGQKRGSLSDTKRKDVYDTINKLNSKRVVLVNQERITSEYNLKKDTRQIMAEAWKTEVENEDGTTSPRTHSQRMALIDKMRKTNPDKVGDLQKALDENRYVNNDPAVFNKIKSAVIDGKYENDNEIDKAVLANNLSNKQWSDLRNLQAAKEEEKKKGILPIYETDFNYKSGLSDVMRIVKGNYNVGVTGREKPNSGAAVVDALNFAKTEIDDFDAKHKAAGTVPSLQEKRDFLKTLTDISKEYFKPDTLTTAIPTSTEYEKDIENKEKAEVEKGKKYNQAGVTSFVNNVNKIVDSNSSLIVDAVTTVVNSFDPSFAGIPFTGSDSKFGESDKESRQRVLNEQLPKLLSTVFENSGFTTQVMETLEDSDFDKFKKTTVDNINKFLRTQKLANWKPSDKITTDQLDQALQLLQQGGK